MYYFIIANKIKIFDEILFGDFSKEKLSCYFSLIYEKKSYGKVKEKRFKSAQKLTSNRTNIRRTKTFCIFLVLLGLMFWWISEMFCKHVFLNVPSE